MWFVGIMVGKNTDCGECELTCILCSWRVFGFFNHLIVFMFVWTGTFKLVIEFSEEYPNKPPTVRFLSKMFHPNGE